MMIVEIFLTLRYFFAGLFPQFQTEGKISLFARINIPALPNACNWQQEASVLFAVTM